MRLFDKLYGQSKEQAAAAKKPVTETRVKLGFDSAINSLETAKIDTEQAIDKLRAGIANGNVEGIRQLAEKAVELVETQAQIDALSAERDGMFAETK